MPLLLQASFFWTNGVTNFGESELIPPPRLKRYNHESHEQVPVTRQAAPLVVLPMMIIIIMSLSDKK